MSTSWTSRPKHAAKRSLSAPFAAAAALCLAGSMFAQDPTKSEASHPPEPANASYRLVDRLPTPLVHLEVTARTAAKLRDPNALLELLGSDALTSILAAWEGSDTASDGSPKGQTISSTVRLFFTRSNGALELALTGFSSARAKHPSMPLLVIRGVLTAADAGKVPSILLVNGFGRKGKTLGGHPSWDHSESGMVVVLVGRELLISNHRPAMLQVVGSASAHTAAKHPKDSEVLAGRRGYRKLRATVTDQPGSLIVWVDPTRLELRLPRFVRNLLPASAFSWMGVANGDDVLASVESVRGELQTTLLTVAQTKDGMLALASSVKAKNLAPGLPGRGIASAVWAWAPQSLQEISLPLVSAMRERFAGSCDVAGLDLDKQVLRRLGKRSAVRGWLAQTDAGAFPVLTVQAKDRRSAQMLYQDLSRAAEELGFGKVESVQPGSNRVMPRLDLFNVCGRGQSLSCAVMDGSLILAHESYADAILRDLRRDGGMAKRKRSSILPWLQALEIENEEVAGLFELDLTNTLESFCASAKIDVDTSTLPLRHVGYVQMQEDGTVRLRLLSRSAK